MKAFSSVWNACVQVCVCVHVRACVLVNEVL